MLKRKIIGFFLIMVFLIPVMPIMEVGFLLGQNQLTEEIAHHGEADSKARLNDPDQHSFIFTVSQTSLFRSDEIWESDENIISRQADDIQTPPPNM
jgi:hypothetical protein